MRIKFTIEGQRLAMFVPDLVSDTVGYLDAVCTFSEDWEGTDRWMHLVSPLGVDSPVQLVDDMAMGIDVAGGRWQVWFHGNDMTSGVVKTRIVTNTVSFVVSKSGIKPDGPLGKIPLSVAEQIAANSAEALRVANEALELAQESGANATLSESWAVGGTGARPGEDTDNSKYYAEQAKQSETASAESAAQAKLSEGNAKASETAAGESETQAKLSEDDAKASETAAGESAAQAKLSEDNAKASEIAAAESAAETVGLTVAAVCEDEAASATSATNTWYVPKTMPRPNGTAGMMIDVFWVNGRMGGLGYNVSLVWGEPGGADNETVISQASVTDTLTGEVSIPTEGTVRYQLINRNDRLVWKYVSGDLLVRQYSTDAASADADKPVHGLEKEYLPGMVIYVQLDKGNSSPLMRLVPDAGPTLPVYGNGAGTETGALPAGYICHLVNAEDHWQLINSPGGGGSGGGAVTSVNGQIGDVVLEAKDVGAVTAEEVDSAIQSAKAIHTTIITPNGGGGYVADMTASAIIDADRNGIVKAEFTDPVTSELRTYYYAKQMPDGRAAFSKDGYIEDGVPKQTIIYVDYAGNVSVETRSPFVDADLSETSELPVQNKAVTKALGEKVAAASVGTASGVAALDPDGKVPAAQLPGVVVQKDTDGRLYVDI